MYLSTQQHPASTTRVTSYLRNIRSKAVPATPVQPIQKRSTEEQTTSTKGDQQY